MNPEAPPPPEIKQVSGMKAFLGDESVCPTLCLATELVRSILVFSELRRTSFGLPLTGCIRVAWLCRSQEEEDEEEDQENPQEQEQGGLSKSGKELKKLLGKAAKEDDSDGGEDDDGTDEDVMFCHANHVTVFL